MSVKVLFILDAYGMNKFNNMFSLEKRQNHDKFCLFAHLLSYDNISTRPTLAPCLSINRQVLLPVNHAFLSTHRYKKTVSFRILTPAPLSKREEQNDEEDKKGNKGKRDV